ncbi:hypothetical protein FD50_GL001052 [Liquorilactobacillus satsumensis DSM 16230 = JCM 12392]|uniref:Prepilin peptidase A24 N-terminal domain-containing protein n=2 Tax=Liquorilactobacillus satsumensis TaxID=259059 RepID=A0A0R1UYL2_9LACO|nr:hypothetical protein FD50_GL001052 [Liquorilactobacillus satsumensis DSM 16230 = JCM 12392]
MKTVFLFLLIFLLGSSCASFSVCCGWRFAHSISLFVPSSFCEHCHHRLKLYQLIPLLSFCLQRGHCFFCGQQIARTSTVVELLFGGYSVLLFWHANPISFLFLFIVALWSLILSMQDYYSRTVSATFLLGGAFLMLSISFVVQKKLLNDWGIILPLAALLLLLVLLKKMGSADLYYLLFVMLAFGTLATLFTCLFASLGALCFNYFSLKKEIPFIPYLSSGILLFFLIV